MSKTTTGLAIKDILWRQSQPSWAIESSKLRLILTKHGLNIASISLLDDPVQTNPFWIPDWPWNDPSNVPHMKVSGEMEKLYGNLPESQLLSNTCGHNICLDRFGFCKDTDIPRTCHGEAGISLFRLITNKQNENKVSFSTSLPIAGLDVNRSFEFDDDHNSITVSTRMDNKMEEYSKIDRHDIEWCENVTIGDPFLNQCVFTADVDNAYNFGAELPKSRFKEYGLLQRLPVTIEECLYMPLIEDKSIEIEECIALRVKDGGDIDNIATFKAKNQKLGFELEYEFSGRVFPWITVWTEHYARNHSPWNGKQRARGMEFSTKPLPMADLETQPAFKGRIKEVNGRKLFEEKPIDFVLPPQGRTETFTFTWNRL